MALEFQVQVQCCFTSTETVRTNQGREAAQAVHLDFHTVPVTSKTSVGVGTKVETRHELPKKKQQREGEAR